MNLLMGRPCLGLFLGFFVRDVGYSGLLMRQGVSISLCLGMYWTVCRGGIGSVSKWTDLGLGDSKEVPLWLKQSPVEK